MHNILQAVEQNSEILNFDSYRVAYASWGSNKKGSNLTQLSSGFKCCLFHAVQILDYSLESVNIVKVF